MCPSTRVWSRLIYLLSVHADTALLPTFGDRTFEPRDLKDKSSNETTNLVPDIQATVFMSTGKLLEV
jgi:hypothetical protein